MECSWADTWEASQAWRVREALFGETDEGPNEEEEWMIGPQVEDFREVGDIPVLSPLQQEQLEQATWTASRRSSLLGGGLCSGSVERGEDERAEGDQVGEGVMGEAESGGGERSSKEAGPGRAGRGGGRGRSEREVAAEQGKGQIQRSPGRSGTPVSLRRRGGRLRQGPHEEVRLRDPREEGDFPFSDEDAWPVAQREDLEGAWWDPRGERWEVGPRPPNKEKAETEPLEKYRRGVTSTEECAGP
ncbi:uncharacterized protein LOC121917946 isoform X2 [Sceloporus undulatus]|uniref:uncharacterized protein LOC121917946 isoform X2 n=1 Tax=Sceloporus undulatus TaxID=8520 RepID=UPI001C4BF8F6|nr:uncharacterized protein LOC121917946 isoform X2 [Sceloporus undulatus]